jgi:hypothetical protein
MRPRAICIDTVSILFLEERAVRWGDEESLAREYRLS